ncbi:tryptophan-rich sensory protein [Cohnella ginsengisoli]|uniref:Tryptophan-rich sensory protein n=1 Tax=Cohnella ginsengisoli TaxID=425004 RepID=A0A9X4QQ14_9BACL|nr:TspO/MBR family protein [Cohnella ginsengisoli]MDG0793265.1 tryptophan-rich sensory protein [Cohnella ginsengisoli]
MPLHWRILNAAGWLGVVSVNAAAATGGLFGRSSGEISDKVPTLVTPAGYAFSIWSVIYLLALGYVVAAFLPSRRHDQTMRATAPWFFASCLFNVGWLFVWHAERYTASAFVISGLLLTLIALYLSSRPAARAAGDRSGFFLIALPFSIYLGWVTVATIVNISVALRAGGWDGWGVPDRTWAVALFVVAAALSAVAAFKDRDPWFPLTVAWALIAIGVKQQSASQLVAVAAWTAASIAIAAALFKLRGIAGLKPRRM